MEFAAVPWSGFSPTETRLSWNLDVLAFVEEGKPEKKMPVLKLI